VKDGEAIKAALAAGETIPGVTVTRGNDYVMVR
jgi:hypothetical protein